MDSELICILTKAAEALGLEWSAPEDPARSCLDEWFLPESPYQRPALFFPEVDDKLMKSRGTPYSACVHSATLTFSLLENPRLFIRPSTAEPL